MAEVNQHKVTGQRIHGSMSALHFQSEKEVERIAGYPTSSLSSSSSSSLPSSSIQDTCTTSEFSLRRVDESENKERSIRFSPYNLEKSRGLRGGRFVPNANNPNANNHVHDINNQNNNNNNDNNREENHSIIAKTPPPSPVGPGAFFSNPYVEPISTVVEGHPSSSSASSSSSSSLQVPSVSLLHQAETKQTTTNSYLTNSTGVVIAVGCNYPRTNHALSGCIKDAEDVARWAKTWTKNPSNDVILMTDEESPITLAKFITSMFTLAVRTWREQIPFVWIHFSGHGSYKFTTEDKLEKDGYNETIVLSDGDLEDDYMNMILSSFHPSTVVVFVCDSCHSGTIADLVNIYNVNMRTHKVEMTQDRVSTLDKISRLSGSKLPEFSNCTSALPLTGTRFPPIVTLSGCRDEETSGEEPHSGGRLTQTLLRLIDHNKGCVRLNLYALFTNVIAEVAHETKNQQNPLISTNFNFHTNYAPLSTKVDISRSLQK